MIISSFYFTWIFFLMWAVVLYNLATTGEPGVFTALTPEESTARWIDLFFTRIPPGVALIIGGIFVLKRMGARTKDDQCKDQI